MAESQHDDLADALARMADGNIAPSEHEPQAPPLTPPPARAVKPASARPAVAKPALPSVAKPAAPGVPAPAVRPVGAARAARPAAPTVRTATLPPVAAPAPAAAAAMVVPPSARKARPAAPTARSATVSTTPNALEVNGDQSTAMSNQAGDGTVIDDDDAVIVPAPDPSVFEYDSKASSALKAKVARQKSIDFRRTLIPILLTCGVLLLVVASLKFVSGPDSVLTDLNIGIPIGLFVMAVILLGLAVVNMISVKKQMGDS